MFVYMQTDLRDGKNILMNGSNLSGLLVKAGFTDITKKEIKVPISTWDSGLQFRLGI